MFYVTFSILIISKYLNSAMNYIMKFSIIYILMLLNLLYAECSDLDSTECLQWAEFCEWNEDTDMCQEIGGGGESEYGPYQFSYITESDGLRNGSDYRDGMLYYPIDAELPYGSIVLTPGWGGGSSSMTDWGEFFASHGFIAMTIGPNDEINDSHQQRAEGLLDAITTIKEEELRIDSPLFGMIDTDRFIVSGYSMGGGASQVALTLEELDSHQSIVAAIALNPTIIFEDCDICTDNEYCICLVPEFLDHDIPTLIIAGENEIDELPSYDGLLGQDIYENTPNSTLKMLYEIGDGGHSSAAYPAGEVQEKTLYWAKYHLLEDLSYCDSLLISPNNASQFMTTLQCENNLTYDVNGDGVIDNSDLVLLVVSVLNDNITQNSGDFNYDQNTDIFDILILSDHLQ